MLIASQVKKPATVVRLTNQLVNGELVRGDWDHYAREYLLRGAGDVHEGQAREEALAGC